MTEVSNFLRLMRKTKKLKNKPKIQKLLNHWVEVFFKNFAKINTVSKNFQPKTFQRKKVYQRGRKRRRWRRWRWRRRRQQQRHRRRRQRHRGRHSWAFKRRDQTWLVLLGYFMLENKSNHPSAVNTNARAHVVFLKKSSLKLESCKPVCEKINGRPSRIAQHIGHSRLLELKIA